MNNYFQIHNLIFVNSSTSKKINYLIPLKRQYTNSTELGIEIFTCLTVSNFITYGVPLIVTGAGIFYLYKKYYGGGDDGGGGGGGGGDDNSKFVEHVQEPLMEHVQKPLMEHVQEPLMEHVQEPLMEHVQKPLMEHVQEPLMEHVQEPLMEHVQKPLMEHVQEPLMEHVQKPLMEHVQEPLMESSMNFEVDWDYLFTHIAEWLKFSIIKSGEVVPEITIPNSPSLESMFLDNPSLELISNTLTTPFSFFFNHNIEKGDLVSNVPNLKFLFFLCIVILTLKTLSYGLFLFKKKFYLIEHLAKDGGGYHFIITPKYIKIKKKQFTKYPDLSDKIKIQRQLFPYFCSKLHEIFIYYISFFS